MTEGAVLPEGFSVVPRDDEDDVVAASGPGVDDPLDKRVGPENAVLVPIADERTARLELRRS